jgi:hypothetical protein
LTGAVRIVIGITNHQSDAAAEQSKAESANQMPGNGLTAASALPT